MHIDDSWKNDSSRKNGNDNLYRRNGELVLTTNTVGTGSNSSASLKSGIDDSYFHVN